MSGVESEAQRSAHTRKCISKAGWKSTVEIQKCTSVKTVTCVCYKLCKVTSV